MPNVKPGDLCIILGVKVTPELNGRIVEVIGKSYVGDKYQRVGWPGVTTAGGVDDKVYWEVKSKEPLPWYLNSINQTILHVTVPVADRRLFKIKDKDVDMETETVKELEKV